MIERGELHQRIIDRLNAAGLGQHLVADMSQLFEFPEEYFAEVVVDDAGRIDDANAVMEKIAQEMSEQNQDLDYIVRAVWQVTSVIPLGEEELSTQMGEGFFGLRFLATLKSGSREQKVGVEVMPGAYGRLGIVRGPDPEALRKSIKRELEGWLSIRGPGYWDPIREPRRIIGGAEASYAFTTR